MRVELLYFNGCPSWEAADGRLAKALATLGRDDVVERHRVETPEQAEELRFTGSPTILVDGTDPFASGTEQVGLACRTCATSTGPSGFPDTAQLLEALS